MLMYSIMLLLTILVSVAFFTLLERKILGYIHLRLGPNKNMIIGLGQPFNDLVKLFSKKEYKFSMNNFFFFFISPFLLVLFSSLLWMLFQHSGSMFNIKYFFVILMIINGMVTFFFLFPGWSSGSFYSSLGGYRSSAQCISYEGVFFFSIMSFMMLFSAFNAIYFTMLSYLFQNFLTLLMMLFPWVISILAESNRSPFDFAEGESELVSGFNTEYGGGLFSIIFLSEYMGMLFLSFITSFFFFGKSSFFFFGFFFILLLYVWLRTSFPRLRYDKLMAFSWKSVMFFITGIFYFYMLIFIY